MLRVKQNNVIYDIDERQLDAFLKDGFDQIDPKTGKVIKQATGGKKYSVEEFRALQLENKKLKAKIAALEKKKSASEQLVET